MQRDTINPLLLIRICWSVYIKYLLNPHTEEFWNMVDSVGSVRGAPLVDHKDSLTLVQRVDQHGEVGHGYLVDCMSLYPDGVDSCLYLQGWLWPDVCETRCLSCLILIQWQLTTLLNHKLSHTKGTFGGNSYYKGVPLLLTERITPRQFEAGEY